MWDMPGGFETWTVSDPKEAASWLFAHLGPSAHLARVEFYVLDMAFAVAWPYDGPPVTVPLAELPPERLLRQP